MATYKIYVDTDGLNLHVCTGSYKSFESAKKQMQKMIVHLITQNEFYGDGEWENWKETFPTEIQNVLTMLEKTGGASESDEEIEGETEYNSFRMCDNELEIEESVNGEYVPNLLLYTDALGMDPDQDEYSFRLWTSLGAEEGLIIRMSMDEE